MYLFKDENYQVTAISKGVKPLLFADLTDLLEYVEQTDILKFSVQKISIYNKPKPPQPSNKPEVKVDVKPFTNMVPLSRAKDE